jgi:cytochrome P450
MSKFTQEYSDSFTYLRYCFQESLRIESPVVYSNPSCFYRDVTLGGVTWKAEDDHIIVAFDYL